jgi:hypothetical protein
MIRALVDHLCIAHAVQERTMLVSPLRFAIATALVVVASAASSQTIYRCTDASGHVTISDRLCGTVSEGRTPLLLRQHAAQAPLAREPQRNALRRGEPAVAGSGTLVASNRVPTQASGERAPEHELSRQ